jgi:hypothetical protein
MTRMSKVIVRTSCIMTKLSFHDFSSQWLRSGPQSATRTPQSYQFQDGQKKVNAEKTTSNPKNTPITHPNYGPEPNQTNHTSHTRITAVPRSTPSNTHTKQPTPRAERHQLHKPPAATLT